MGSSDFAADRPALVESFSPTEGTRLQSLDSLARDCLQYRVETRADGSEVWNADYVYVYLLDARTHKLMRGPAGRPLASRLRMSQAHEFMFAHPDLEARSVWAVRLARYVQVVKGQKILERRAPVIVDDFDLDALFKKDAEARAR